MSKLQEIKDKAFSKLLKDLKEVGYGSTTSKLVTEAQLKWLKANYLVARTPKSLGEYGRPYLICRT